MAFAANERGKLTCRNELFVDEHTLERRQPSLIIIPRIVAKIVSAFPFADCDDQLLAEILPIKIAGSGKRLILGR